MKKELILFLLVCLSGCVFAQNKWTKIAKESIVETDKSLYKNDTVSITLSSEEYLNSRKKKIEFQIDSLYSELEMIRKEEDLSMRINEFRKKTKTRTVNN
jgi:hypothetical protein